MTNTTTKSADEEKSTKETKTTNAPKSEKRAKTPKVRKRKMQLPDPLSTSQKQKIEAIHERSESISELFKLIGHEDRILVLSRLSAGTCTVTQLKDQLGMQQTTVSQILKGLRKEGVATLERDGVMTWNSIPEPVKKVLDLLFDEVLGMDDTRQALKLQYKKTQKRKLKLK